MLIFFFISLLVLSLFGNTLFPPVDKIIYGGDLLTQFYYWKGYLAESIRSGFIPFWNPYNFSGTPFLAHPSTAFFYPPTAIFFLFPLNLSFSIYYFVHFIIAGFGTYTLLRTYTNKLSSFGGAAAFVLSGYFASRIYAGHVDILSTSAWIPWVFWAIRKIFQETSKINFIYLIMSFSLEILAGYMTIVLFTGELVGFYLLYNLLFDYISKRSHSEFISGSDEIPKQVRNDTKIKIWSKKYLLILISIIFSIGVTSVQWLPTFEFIRLSIRGNGLPYDLASWGSLPVSGLKLYWNPFDYLELAKITYGFGGFILPNFFEFYMGKVVLIVIIIFIVIRLLIVMLNSFQHLKWILKPIRQAQGPEYIEGQVQDDSKLPIRDYLKINPDFWSFFLIILFFIWASFGFQAKLNLHQVLYNVIPFYRNIRIPAQHLIVVSFLLPLMFGLIIGNLRNRLLQGIIIFLLLLELFPYSKKFYLLTDLPEKKHDKELIEVLKNTQDYSRLLPNFSVVSPVLNIWDFNSSIKYKLQSTGGYDPMILRSYYNFIEKINNSHQSMIPYYNVEVPPIDTRSPLMDRLNIGYILTEPKTPLLDQTKYQILINQDKYILYKNKNPTNRLYLVNQNENSGCSEDTKADVKLLKYWANEIEISTKTDCDYILVSSEVYFPGWRATIDDIETAIFQENNTFRAINLPKGFHRVKFFYSPNIYYLGGFISLFAVFTLIVFLNFYKLRLKEPRQVTENK